MEDFRAASEYWEDDYNVGEDELYIPWKVWEQYYEYYALRQEPVIIKHIRMIKGKKI